VRFEGYVPPEDLPGYYRSCDIYCSPAIGLESFGIVLLEAMASQRPVAASDIPGYRNVFSEGIEGLFFRPRDPIAIAECLVRLLQNQDLARRMGEAGRRRSLEFDWPKVAQAVHEYYLEVVGRESSRSCGS
jgi:phosphatidylinositol alpha-mannosyltransferase